MTRAERRVHLAVWVILGPLCLALLIASILGRASSAADETPPRAPGAAR
jgi:hypothetical protein